MTSSAASAQAVIGSSTESPSRRCDRSDPPRLNKLAIGLFISAVLVFVADRFWHLTSYGLFGDEVFTLWTAAQDWRSLFASVVGDVAHPPLFYVLLKLWIDVGGQSLLWVKLLPALLSIGSLVPFVFLCRELKIEPLVMVLALWLMSVNGFLINHAQELRMYSLLLFLAISSLWLFARLLNRDGNANAVQVALCAVNLLLVFTHYSGWAVVGLQLIYLLISKRERLRSFTIALAFLLLCFSPWVYFVTQAARANPSRVNFVWNRPPPASELVGYYSNLNGPLSYRWKVFGTAMVLLAFLCPVIAWGWRLTRSGGDRAKPMVFWLLALFAFGPPAVAFVASHVLPQPVWAFRYLIVSAPAYLLMVAAGACSLSRRRLRIVAVVLILGWSALSGFAEMTNPVKIAWQPLVQQMIHAEPEQSNVRIYVTDANVGNTIQFYLDEANETRLHTEFIDDLSSVEDDHYWVGFIRYKHEAGPLPQHILIERGYVVGDVVESETAGHKAILFAVWKRD